MTALLTDLRSRLESTVKQARAVAEKGARQALEALAVPRHEPHGSMTRERRSLRNRLRAHGRQLGDTRAPSGAQAIERLVREVAYEHWHRMLFARFLMENHLLIEPASGVAVTMEECEDLARERSKDPWGLTASFAERMLPQIFRTGDPALAVTLPPETRQALQRLLTDLPGTVFTEDDSLGWTYQFWQAAEKDAVNARVKSGEKVTGETLPAVTQLFTEPYMVHFLLHNTIGAWHAGKVLPDRLREGAVSEEELRNAVRLTPAGGYDFEYLRFVRDPKVGDADGESTGRWRPAAGTFEEWPKEARELKVLDPCCGSGHFLVAAFQLLVRLRMQEEGLGLAEAVRCVIADNLFGLELDARCTQIAAFNLALAAWKLVGSPIAFPPMRIACSGMGPQATRDEWLSLAERAAAEGGMPGKRDLFGSEETLLTVGVQGGLEALYDLFERAPELGSLIDPTAGEQFDALQADFGALAPLLEAIFEREGVADEEAERAVAAKGMAEAARILVGPSGGYTLVVTNVPYLGRGVHTDRFKKWADTHHKEAKHDLATIFIARMLRWVGNGERAGTVAAVTPQNWLFLTTYRKLRERLLKERTWGMVARLGPGAFETIGGHVVNVALVFLSGGRPDGNQVVAGIDVAAAGTPVGKAALLRGEAGVPDEDPALDEADVAGGVRVEEPGVRLVSRPAKGSITLAPQAASLKMPDFRVTLVEHHRSELLSESCTAFVGLGTGDLPKYARCLVEFPEVSGAWTFFQGPVDRTCVWGGTEQLITWDHQTDRVAGMSLAARDRIHNQDQSGQQAWGRTGVSISLMGELRASLFTGEKYDKATAVLIPDEYDPQILAAIWCYCSSPEFNTVVRQVDRNVMCSSGALVKVPFDLPRWQKVAEERYPDGLPEPYSDDPMQWLFHGHPAHAEPGTALHVAVARLLGYRWPAELDPEMRLSDEARALVERSRELEAAGFTDADGIVCLSSVRGEPAAADRLRNILAAAFGTAWSGAEERELLAAAAEAGHGNGRPRRTIEEWLRNAFFEEHCKLFQHRPFIWHVWDGMKDGFSALVNYHRLAGPDGLGRRTIESLTFSYLGEWIDRQRADQQSGAEGADARLAASLRLQEELRRILEGEPPFDIFIRWKPLHEQPIGWDPDINDGVRLNMRPFMMAQDAGRRILRWKPNVKWTKDRGKEPESLRPPQDFPWFWGCDPLRDPRHRIDFGADSLDATLATETFDGVRWNELHYTRAAKEAARTRARAGAEGRK